MRFTFCSSEVDGTAGPMKTAVRHKEDTTSTSKSSHAQAGRHEMLRSISKITFYCGKDGECRVHLVGSLIDLSTHKS